MLGARLEPAPPGQLERMLEPRQCERIANLLARLRGRARPERPPPCSNSFLTKPLFLSDPRSVRNPVDVRVLWRRWLENGFRLPLVCNVFEVEEWEMRPAQSRCLSRRRPRVGSNNRRCFTKDHSSTGLVAQIRIRRDGRVAICWARWRRSLPTVRRCVRADQGAWRD